ncbi:hypothetical protein MN116_008864, partial [Schistosoma mekongi]
MEPNKAIHCSLSVNVKSFEVPRDFSKITKLSLLQMKNHNIVPTRLEAFLVSNKFYILTDLRMSFTVGELPPYIHRLSKPPQGSYTSLSTPVLRVTRSGRMNPNALDIEGQISGADNQIQTQTVCCMATLVPFSNHKQFYSTIAFTKTGEYSRRMSPYDLLPVDMESCA